MIELEIEIVSDLITEFQINDLSSTLMNSQKNQTKIIIELPKKSR